MFLTWETKGVFEDTAKGELPQAGDGSKSSNHLRGEMVAMKTYYVYIMTNNSRTLYTGVTSNLERRVLQHKRKLLPGFTREYNINRLVYYETFGDIGAAIRREKQIKGWLRVKKV